MPPQTLTTALDSIDHAHHDAAAIIHRMRKMCSEFQDVAAHSRACLADSRALLRAVNEQLRDGKRIVTELRESSRHTV